MPQIAQTKDPWRKRAAFLGVWTFLGLFFATKSYFETHAYGHGLTWTKALWWHLMEWYGWAACSPFIFYACRKGYELRGRWPVVVLLHLVAGCTSALLQIGICSVGALLESWALKTPLSWGYLYKIIFITHAGFNLFVYAAIVSVWHASQYYRKWAERELKSSELEARLAQAQLHALKAQLQPHFLFNTLNGIASLNYEDPKAANRMIARLSELLRGVLDSDGAPEVSLREELNFNQRYLELEQIRLGERLAVQWRVSPEALNARVPSLLLQPLLENAIRHAIAPFARPGQVSLEARREAGALRIQITDSGPGLSRGVANPEGVGLGNTRARLKQLYGAEHTFDIQNAPEGGTVVDITIPFRPGPDHAALPAEFEHENSRADRG